MHVVLSDRSSSWRSRDHDNTRPDTDTKKKTQCNNLSWLPCMARSCCPSIRIEAAVARKGPAQLLRDSSSTATRRTLTVGLTMDRRQISDESRLLIRLISHGLKVHKKHGPSEPSVCPWIVDAAESVCVCGAKCQGSSFT